MVGGVFLIQSDIIRKPWQGTVMLVHSRRSAMRLTKPSNIAWLGEGKATFSPADNRFVLVDSQNNPMHLIILDVAHNDTLTVGARSVLRPVLVLGLGLQLGNPSHTRILEPWSAP